MHIAGRAYDTSNGGSKAISKWQFARITLRAGFTKISLSRKNKFGRCQQQGGRRAERTNINGNTGWAQTSADSEVEASKAQAQRVMDLT